MKSAPDLGKLNWMTTRVDAALGWARKFSIFQYPFVTACCGMEYMATAASHYDMDRFGAGFPRFSPRQSDVLFVVGTISHKIAPVLRRVYDQMTEPKCVVAFGVCTCTGGFYDNYATVQGIDTLIPVDVYIPGCPPRPENVLDGLMKLQAKIQPQHSGVTLGASSQAIADPAVVRRESLRAVAQHLRDEPELAFNVLMDLTAVDGLKLGAASRFEVVYHFYSLEQNRRLRLKVPVEEQDPTVDSLADLWPSANWFEREVWDMFGIRFRGHPSLKRLLMYEEFSGHPLRKDYPVNRRQPLIGPGN